CVPDKNWVLEMSKSLSKKEIVGVQGKYQTKQNDTIAKFVQLEIEDRYERMKNRRFIDFIGSYSAGYKKDVFIKYDGFDETFPTASGEDPELSFKVSKDGHKMVFNEKAIVYHTHVDSVGKYLKQKFWRAYWRVLLYKKHPGKMKSESYTPQTIKLQIMLLCLFGLSLVALPFIKESLYISLFSILVLFLLVLPLSFKNFGKNKKVGVITPFMSILRTIVFMFGLAIGAVRV
ncbi:MAG: hypothetical protein KAS32_07025, partial [Candidatus Peribacteraceae bacterium]|nr:hypothetical protein [Candidatus Peribacteraceae bacterium]